MTYESPRDELLLGILVLLATPILGGTFAPVLAIAGVFIGTASYLSTVLGAT